MTFRTEHAVEKRKPSNTLSLSVRILLLTVLFIILSPTLDIYARQSPPPDNTAALQYPSLINAPIEELELAAENCPLEKRAKFSITVHPSAFNLWPNQQVLISWWINNSKGERWIFPVYLRKEEEGEEVSPIWMQTIKSSDLPEGLNTYYLTTYCGVAKIEVAKAPRPEITGYPLSVMRGDTMEITGLHFNNWDPDLLREVRIIEQGGTRTLDIEEWTDDKIIVSLPGDLYPGRQKIYVTSGTTKGRSRRSQELPIAVVYKERFPSLTITSLLEKIFSGMIIHLNNYGPQRSGSRLIEDDAYISFDNNPDTERFHLVIEEYYLATELVSELTSPYSYYINDINMDYVTVARSDDGWTMTFYFEKIDDELIGIDTENMDIRAYVPEDERPLNIQIDNLKIKVEFDLMAIGGDMIIEQKKVESFASLNGPDSGCIFKDVDICEELTGIYEKDLLSQLSEIMELTLSVQSTRALFTKALEPWLKSYSIGEVILITLDNDEVVMDYLPPR